MEKIFLLPKSSKRLIFTDSSQTKLLVSVSDCKYSCFFCVLRFLLCRTGFYTDIPNLQRVLLKIRRTFKIRSVCRMFAYVCRQLVVQTGNLVVAYVEDN